jgi:hypothetical protein
MLRSPALPGELAAAVPRVGGAVVVVAVVDGAKYDCWGAPVADGRSVLAPVEVPRRVVVPVLVLAGAATTAMLQAVPAAVKVEKGWSDATEQFEENRAARTLPELGNLLQVGRRPVTLGVEVEAGVARLAVSKVGGGTDAGVGRRASLQNGLCTGCQDGLASRPAKRSR